MDYLLYGSIGLGVLLILILFISLLKRRPKKESIKTLDQQELNQLYEALGQKENILKVDLEHQRLKVDLKDTKKVNPTLIKALNIPAFLTGNTIKLLIKSSPKAVQTYLENKRKEAN
ncbi:MAG: hypothetical protein ACNA7K_02905 [Acholeplasmataceae bacterium]